MSQNFHSNFASIVSNDSNDNNFCQSQEEEEKQQQLFQSRSQQYWRQQSPYSLNEKSNCETVYSQFDCQLSTFILQESTKQNSTIVPSQSWIEYSAVNHPIPQKTQFDKKFDHHLLRIFKQLAKLPRLSELLCNSLFGDICGNEAIKHAILLALFGGTIKCDQECPTIVIHDHIHILLLGNGISQKNLLLKRITTSIDNSCYLVGGSSTLKLIALGSNCKSKCVTKGVLITHGREIICFDELEKLDRTQQQVLMQSIEHQRIGVKEGEVIVFYPSNVTLIAAASLAGIEYDYTKPVERNVRHISADLISKWNLIFLVDENAYAHDDELYEKEIKRFCNINDTCSIIDDNMRALLQHESQALGEAIFQKSNNCLLSEGLVCKYIEYCRQYIHPTIDDEVENIVRSFCLNEISFQNTGSKLRIFETICRLCEAHAKMSMRTQVSVQQDMAVIMDIVQCSLNLLKRIVPAAAATISVNKKNNLKPSLLYKLLTEACKYYNKRRFTVQEIGEMCLQYVDSKLDSWQILDIINCLNEQALLLKKDNCYEVL